MPEEEGQFYGKHGEPRKYDPTFKGPIYNRGCTDIVCCILFILAILGYFAVGILAWTQGDPRKVIYPTDSRGRFCGQAGRSPSCSIFNIIKCASPLVLLEFQCPTTQICVEKCPSQFMTLLEVHARQNEDFKYFKTFCKEDADISKLSVPDILKKDLCPAVLTPSKPCKAHLSLYILNLEIFLSTSNTAVYKVFNETDCKHSYNTCDPDTFNTSDVIKECPDSQCMFAFYGGESYYHKYLIALQFYNVFLFFWCANFVTALGQMTLAGAFASYYWAFKKPEDMPACPIFSSLGRALRYHTGTLAFGSLLLSLIQTIRVLLEYVDHKLKGTHNKCTRFLMCCLKCCFWCLEKFIKFLNRNAYIMVAIYGKNFCTSARDAFFLLMRNVIRVAVLDKVTDFLLFLGKLLIVGSVGIFAFFFFSGRIKAIEETIPTLNYYWVPILTVVVGSYLIAHGFFSVYAMCVDTLFLCFLEDLERNDGSAERPYLMPENLLKVLKKKNDPKVTDQS
ncbi:hypothetical protein SKAU_G00293410 [Synaphobranchus kaupii]|uniref:Choline transporter-like protein n=1 Tax=Synaphobranchus kaupii TaxID=118154 RepID=A0A9Q1IMI4_SYNKA|nr:hypothetical protein SKAU_G00293410 [Synaphobranchus kaupii]